MFRLDKIRVLAPHVHLQEFRAATNAESNVPLTRTPSGAITPRTRSLRQFFSSSPATSANSQSAKRTQQKTLSPSSSAPGACRAARLMAVAEAAASNSSHQKTASGGADVAPRLQTPSSSSKEKQLLTAELWESLQACLHCHILIL